MLVVPSRAATPWWNGYGARPTQSVGHGPWSMKHAGMPRYALKCKLVSHRVGVDGTSGPSLLLSCPLDASTQRVRARGNTCPRCVRSPLPLFSSSSPRRPFSSRGLYRIHRDSSLHHDTETASPWHGDRGSWGCRYALKCRSPPPSPLSIGLSSSFQIPTVRIRPILGSSRWILKRRLSVILDPVNFDVESSFYVWQFVSPEEASRVPSTLLQQLRET